MQPRNTRPPLAARSVIASTLLGADPPWLATRILVRSSELFGIAEGTTRTALSRMVAADEIVPERDGYRLAGGLLERQARQSESRRADTRRGDGTWELALVRAEARSAAERAALRDAMRTLRLAELREGAWARPDNLAPDRSPAAMAVASSQCAWWRGATPTENVGELWDLAGWASDAAGLRDDMVALLPDLERGDTAVLAPGFITSAAVLRHLQADPLLPPRLLPGEWPGQQLRKLYDRYDAAYRAVWSSWFRRQA